MGSGLRLRLTEADYNGKRLTPRGRRRIVAAIAQAMGRRDRRRALGWVRLVAALEGGVGGVQIFPPCAPEPRGKRRGAHGEFHLKN